MKSLRTVWCMQKQELGTLWDQNISKTLYVKTLYYVSTLRSTYVSAPQLPSSGINRNNFDVLPVRVLKNCGYSRTFW